MISVQVSDTRLCIHIQLYAFTVRHWHKHISYNSVSNLQGFQTFMWNPLFPGTPNAVLRYRENNVKTGVAFPVVGM